MRSQPTFISLDVAEAQHLALQLHRSGSFPEAEMLYRRILDVAPDNLDPLHFLAVLCHQAGRNVEAQGLIERIIAFDPENADAHNNLGNVLEGLEKFSGAEECYRKAITLRPDHAPALNNLGVMLMSQKRPAEAVETYRRAVALAPKAADFRYNLGNALRRSGEIDEAIIVYREALALNPDHEGAWQGLARSLLLAGRSQEAGEAFEEWLSLEPGNELALYMRAALLGKNAPDRTPDAYICRVFDGMANRFDGHLINNLEYRAPYLLVDALSAVLPAPATQFYILDAGCGTGLCGPLLKPYARHLCGVDLSRGMVAVAEGRKQYDQLVIAELSQFLAAATDAYDIIASADTLCYFGPLEPVFHGAAKALKAGGLFAFTLEDAGPGTSSWRLDQTARYAHGRSYVEEALAGAGFAIDSLSSAVLRNEAKQPVTGHVVVARKAARDTLGGA
jgi:predicted TPR repeat methyltransferase